VLTSRRPAWFQSWAVWSKKPLRNSCARAWPSTNPVPVAANSAWPTWKYVVIETVPAGSQRMAIIGIGLNVARQDLTPQAGQFSSGFASLDEFEPGLDAPAVLARVARPLVLALKRFAEAGFAPWQVEYASRDLLRGREVVAGNLEGVAQGVSAQGELLVQTADGLLPVSGGEVSVRLGG